MTNKCVMSVDPGNFESAFVIWDGNKIQDFDIIDNESLIKKIEGYCNYNFDFAIEKVASYGMSVGQEVFDTCEFIGRIEQKIIDCQNGYKDNIQKVFRRKVKLHLCESTQAKDGNIVQALIDRFGNVHEHGKYAKGTKKNPGFFYGFSEDVWQAFALAVYYYDNFLAKK